MTEKTETLYSLSCKLGNRVFRGENEVFRYLYDKIYEELSNGLLIPCIVYDYESFEECRRHSIEDNKFSVRPAIEYLDYAERTMEITH